MKTSRTILMPLALMGLLLTSPQTFALPPGGIGVIGDSYSDEYQFYPPDRTTARNWVEILAELRGLDFGPFSSLSRGEPRNQGFEYNWARSDATSEDMIRTGQHTGVASQVARGQVKLVVICIGGNDFIAALKSPEPLLVMERVAPRAIGNVRRAVSTILDADPNVRILLGTVPDICQLPEFAPDIRSGRIPATVARELCAGMKTYNDAIRAMAAGSPRLVLIDFDLTARLTVLVSPRAISFAGRTLDRQHPGNDAQHLFLADRRHVGTIGQALGAQLVIEALNVRLNAGIRPLKDEEILGLADRLCDGDTAVAQTRGRRLEAP